jgi:hypothetical protein
MKSTPNKDISDIFWSTFVGEYVEIACEFETTTSGKLPVALQGYLLDADEEYYFLGKNPIEISSTVKRDKIAYIEIIEDVDQATMILEEMPVPETEEENN